MQRNIPFLSTLIIFSLFIFSNNNAKAQYATAVFEYEKSSFNNSQNLPAEENLMVSGAANPETVLVEITILDDKSNRKDDPKPLFVANWVRPAYSSIGTFTVPVNYKLRGSSEYDLQVDYYRRITDMERENLRQDLYNNLFAYTEQSFTVERKRAKVIGGTAQLVRNLNEIARKGLSLYRNRSQLQFEGFSDLVVSKIDQINKANLKKGKFIFSKEKNKDARSEYRVKLMTELKQLLASELGQVLNVDLLVLQDRKFMDDYPTEKTRTEIPLNVGYGGVHLKGTNSENSSFGTSPYFGLSLPLGKKGFAGEFWSRSSISAGFFLNNFEDDNGNDVTGPIFKRPTYIGLGYRVFRFIRFNAGATFLEDKSQGTSLADQVYVRPFVGFSAEFRFWIDLEK
ncbi:hypothetical protein Fleli_0962 [Bernardetia litoralis DSM 6794]|uniref:Outer membrane protein/protective antigen OMA87 n=1 Tax=Bernardetia litoralis (strain ATCC 23117 / DSM 6794 / NBRC 15988 / NCIMB 1366 / Fx l1 / Sio-4) TaxID=880071 RepID=I4AHH9_BERLS|nr:hypothetical protein [Bernardetia litoralis]AFM03414.1 hypothetical protein Fleli_0962 [Bernardetia litoralis DSM 6794]